MSAGQRFARGPVFFIAVHVCSRSAPTLTSWLGLPPMHRSGTPASRKAHLGYSTPQIREKCWIDKTSGGLHPMVGTRLWDYSRSMNNKKYFLKTGNARFVLCTAVLGTLTGCGVSADAPRPEQVYVQPPSVQVQANIVAQDDYVYYPGYEVYYSRTRRQYVYPEGGGWVSRPAPRGVSVNVLLASPSVAVDFHDSPASHHAAMVQKYPKNWAPSGSNHDQRDDHQGK
jgi:hypothetical protein